MILDIFSRYAVGWMLAHSESAELARRVIRESQENEGLTDTAAPTIHSDRGASMTSETVGQLLSDLSITRSLSRPYTSNDNPFSEAHFRTINCRPEFPDRFGSHRDALSFLRSFFPWYNEHDRHSGIGIFTPGQVHRGEVQWVTEKRQRGLDAAFRAHPEWFKGRRPLPPTPPSEVWINPPAPDRNGDPSSRSRQDLRINTGQGKNDALSAPGNCAAEQARAWVPRNQPDRRRRRSHSWPPRHNRCCVDSAMPSSQ